MKVAIPRYDQRIAPRFGFTQDVLVVELEGRGVRSTESVAVDRRFPHQIPELLHCKGVQVVLTGGINVDFQEMFRALGIKVIWGLIGTPEEALEAFVSGRVSPGMGRCPGGAQRRRRRGCGVPRP
jgi:predicted Fe-Mo cluster-binding NifX family protein